MNLTIVEELVSFKMRVVFLKFGACLRFVFFFKLNVFATENNILYDLSKRKKSLCAQIGQEYSGQWVGTSEENGR